MEERVEGQELLKISSGLKAANGEAEMNTMRVAMKYGGIVTVFLCVIMTILELIIMHRWNFGMVTILFTFSGIADAYGGKKNNENRKFIWGTIELVIAVIFLILFVGGLFA